MIMDAIALSLQDKLQEVSARIQGCEGGDSAVCLIAVSKTQSAQTVALAAQAGQLDFGENYIQEGVDKIAALKPRFPALVWHMIGPIQSNKTRLVATHFDWVHTVDRLKIAQRLSEQRPTHLPPLQVLIQINIDREDSKSGVLPEQALDLALAVAALPNLCLRGLMCIPEQANAASFQKMVQLREQLNAALQAQGSIPNSLHSPHLSNGILSLDVLSMGMSADFEAAIAYGATHVRVGSAIFGVRA